jgi:hypothetical protein
MNLHTELYSQQVVRWPQQGRVILAQFDENSMIVYQAYRPAIGNFAASNNYFGGKFQFARMTWIKPNFLWMMYRCGWATKKNQQVVLAIRLRRSAFEHILAEAIYSNFVPAIYGSHEEWKKAVEQSEIRLQWDPDHDPNGDKIERRAIQLGLRGDSIVAFARKWILDLQDISSFVAEQRALMAVGNYDQLVIPTEQVYPVSDGEVAAKLGLAETAYPIDPPH